ncbi:MAG: hypothetical protein KA821_03555 [Chitinophagaceae bacterium]|nr:hypothetical protein [Chitinophagaceae bacterium]
MILKTTVLALLISFFSNTALAQSSIASCLSDKLTTGSADELQTLTDQLISRLPQKDFYLIGEAHTYLANNDFQFALIKSLHEKGIYNIANELPHATCFLFNEYLQTGNDSILTWLMPKASYTVLKKVREFNLNQPAARQVRYYGIDYLDADYDFTNTYYTLQWIRRQIPSKNLPLDTLIDGCLQKGKLLLQDIAALHSQLEAQLKDQEVIYRNHFGRYYDDLMLMSGNMIGNRTNRDQLIFKSFQTLYTILEKKQSDKPRFLAFYGMGHLGNLGDILIRNVESPVKASVNKIGIQYVNCLGGWRESRLRDDGLYQLKKKDLAELIRYSKSQPWKTAFLTDLSCVSFKSGRSMDAIFIFNSYGDRKMTSWKFD